MVFGFLLFTAELVRSAAKPPTAFSTKRGTFPALALLGKLKLLVRVSTVSESEIQSALSSSFGDFEDAIQHFTARTEGGISAIITRNKADYFDSDIPVLSPEEFLSKRAPTIQ